MAVTNFSKPIDDEVGALNSNITWEDITNSCTWNSGITFGAYRAYHRKGIVVVSAIIYPTGLINSATVVTIPFNALMDVDTPLCVDNGDSVPLTNNIGRLKILGNTKNVLIYKTTANAGYASATIVIPVSE